MNHLKWAILGCGRAGADSGALYAIGYAHAEAVLATPGVELCAASGLDQHDLDAFTHKFGGKGYLDYKEMLTKEKPDVVSVCTYVQNRVEHVTDVIRSGAKAVYVEKPFALNPADAKKMTEAANKADVKLFVNHQRRYGRPFIELKKMIDDRLFGTIQSVDVSIPIPVLLDFGPHIIDTFIFIFGQKKLSMVHAAADSTKPINWHGLMSESLLTGRVLFDDGLQLNVFSGKLCSSKMPVFRVNGQNGFAELTFLPPEDGSGTLRYMTAGSNGVQAPPMEEHFHGGKEPCLYFKRAVADIRDAVLTGKKALLDVDDASFGVVIMSSLLESAKNSKAIYF